MGDLLKKAEKKSAARKPSPRMEELPEEAGGDDQNDEYAHIPIRFIDFDNEKDWLEHYIPEGGFEPIWSWHHVRDAGREPEGEKLERPPRFVHEVTLTKRCRCQSRDGYEVLLADGKRKRIDCAYCNRFIEFSQWHKKGMDA